MEAVWIRWPGSAQTQALLVKVHESEIGADWVARDQYDDFLHCGRCGFTITANGPFWGAQAEAQGREHRQTCAPRTDAEIAACEREWREAIASLPRPLRKENGPP